MFLLIVQWLSVLLMPPTTTDPVYQEPATTVIAPILLVAVLLISLRPCSEAWSMRKGAILFLCLWADSVIPAL